MLQVWLANCYFARNSLRFPALLPFFKASSRRPFHPPNRRPDPEVPTWRRPFPRCRVPHQCAWRPYLTQSHLQSKHAMGNGLSYAHLAPLPLAVVSKAINALLHLICERDIEQVLQ